MLGPRKNNLGKTHEKDFKIAIMSMFKRLKDVRKCVNEGPENTKVEWNNEKFQDMKVIELVKKTNLK